MRSYKREWPQIKLTIHITGKEFQYNSNDIRRYLGVLTSNESKELVLTTARARWCTLWCQSWWTGNQNLVFPRSNLSHYIVSKYVPWQTTVETVVLFFIIVTPMQSTIKFARKIGLTWLGPTDLGLGTLCHHHENTYHPMGLGREH